MRVGTADATPEAESTAPAAEDTPAAPAAEELIAAANEAELEEAATKIQAMHRGRVARKQTNAMRGKGGPSDIEMDQETLRAEFEQFAEKGEGDEVRMTRAGLIQALSALHFKRDEGEVDELMRTNGVHPDGLIGFAEFCVIVKSDSRM